jgi:hypothetical protein
MAISMRGHHQNGYLHAIMTVSTTSKKIRWKARIEMAISIDWIEDGFDTTGVVNWNSDENSDGVEAIWLAYRVCGFFNQKKSSEEKITLMISIWIFYLTCEQISLLHATFFEQAATRPSWETKYAPKSEVFHW